MSSAPTTKSNPLQVVLIRIVAQAAIYFLATVVVLAILGVGILGVSPTLRHQTLRIASGIYKTQLLYALRSYSAGRDISAAAARLEQDLDVIETIGSSSNRYIGDVIEGTAQIVRHLRRPEEYRTMLPGLRRLSAMEPRAYLPQLWLARAMVETSDPDASQQVDRAIALMPADDRGHRLAIRLAQSSNDAAGRLAACRAWRAGFEGGLRSEFQYGYFEGNTNQRMLLELHRNNGDVTVLLNTGIVTGQRQRYVFQADSFAATDAVFLRLSLFPGTTLLLHGLEILDESGWHAVSRRNFTILPDQGFFTDDGQLVFTRRQDQSIAFRRRPGQADFLGRRIGGIALDATFRQLSIAPAEVCGDEEPRG